MDVARHFGLAHLPFRPTIAPEEAWFRGPFADAVSGVLYRLRAGDRVIGLVGPAGSGKSLALRTIAKRLEEAGRRVHHVGRTDQLSDLLPSDGVLLVDEADASSRDALERLHNAACQAFQLVLAGDGAFLTKLHRPTDAQPIWLQPLSTAHAHDFLRDRLARSGSLTLFEPAAIERTLALGGGTPRRIGTIGGAALFEAMLDGATAVTAEHVDRACAMSASLSGYRPIGPVAEAGDATVTRRPGIAVDLATLGWRLKEATGGRIGALVALALGLAALPLAVSVHGPPAAPAVRERAATASSDSHSKSVVPTQTVAAMPPSPAPPLRTPTSPPELISTAADDQQPAPLPIIGPVSTSGPPQAEVARAEIPRKPQPAAPHSNVSDLRRDGLRVDPEPVRSREAPPAPPPAEVASTAQLAKSNSTSVPAEIPTVLPPGEIATARVDEDNRCSCPQGMSAARCNEWKVWHCRSRD